MRRDANAPKIKRRIACGVIHTFTLNRPICHYIYGNIRVQARESQGRCLKQTCKNAYLGNQIPRKIFCKKKSVYSKHYQRKDDQNRILKFFWIDLNRYKDVISPFPECICVKLDNNWFRVPLCLLKSG